MKNKLISEMEKEFREKFGYTFKEYVDREESGSFSEGENLEVFIKEQIQKAYRAGEDDNLEEVSKELLSWDANQMTYTHLEDFIKSLKSKEKAKV